MIFILQLIFGAIGLAANLLDHYIVQAFQPDTHQDIYHYMADYIGILESVIIMVLIAIGIFVENGGIKTLKAKVAWGDTVTAFLVITIIHSLARIHSMVVLCIHTHPGKLDFVGLFFLITMMYYVLRFTVVLAHGTGLHAKITAVVIPTEEEYAMPVRAAKEIQP